MGFEKLDDKRGRADRTEKTGGTARPRSPPCENELEPVAHAEQNCGHYKKCEIFSRKKTTKFNITLTSTQMQCFQVLTQFDCVSRACSKCA